MAASAPTVPQLKQTFIASQVALLSQPPQPSEAWRSANSASDHPIPARALDDALAALENAVRQHCRRVYPPQASRHVADQIAHAYAREAERKVGAEGDVDGAVPKQLDLADETVIEGLPPSWPVARQNSDFPAEAKRYVEATSHLASLNQERKALRLRVDRLRRLEASIAPLNAADGAMIQENLITRNGPIETELERMRLLLARVAGRISGLPAIPADRQSTHALSPSSARKRAVDEFLADVRVFPA